MMKTAISSLALLLILSNSSEGLRTHQEIGRLDSTELDLTELLSSPLYTSKLLDSEYPIPVVREMKNNRMFNRQRRVPGSEFLGKRSDPALQSQRAQEAYARWLVGAEPTISKRVPGSGVPRQKKIDSRPKQYFE